MQQFPAPLPTLSMDDFSSFRSTARGLGAVAEFVRNMLFGNSQVGNGTGDTGPGELVLAALCLEVLHHNTGWQQDRFRPRQRRERHDWSSSTVKFGSSTDS